MGFRASLTPCCLTGVPWQLVGVYRFADRCFRTTLHRSRDGDWFSSSVQHVACYPASYNTQNFVCSMCRMKRLDPFYPVVSASDWTFKRGKCTHHEKLFRGAPAREALLRTEAAQLECFRRSEGCAVGSAGSRPAGDQSRFLVACQTQQFSLLQEWTPCSFGS